jgi:hypothetical protein
VPGIISNTNESTRIVYSEIIDFKFLTATTYPRVIALIIMNDLQFRWGYEKRCSLFSSVCWKLNILFFIICLKSAVRKYTLMIQDEEVKRMFSNCISGQEK